MTIARKFVSVLASLMMAFALIPAAAFAQGSPYLLDDYGLYSKSDANSLEDYAEELSEEYGIGVYLWVTDSVDENARRDTAMDYYTDNNLGLGKNSSGILFMIAVDSRDYVTITKGKAYDIFDDAAVEHVEDDVVDCLHDDDWEGGGYAYYEGVEDVLSGKFVSSGSGAGKHTYNDRSESDDPTLPLDLAIGLVVGLVISGIVCKIFYDQMKTAKEKTEANDFAKGDTFKLTKQSDTFIRSAVTKTPKSDNHSSGGGGGGFGGSGGGKF